MGGSSSKSSSSSEYGRRHEALERERADAERWAAENAERAAQAERDRQAAEQYARQCQEDAWRREVEARQAYERTAAAEREKRAADERARRLQEEARQRAEEAQQARERVERAEREKREAEEQARRCREEAERQEEEAQKARDDLRRGERPDVWPSVEQFEETKTRYGYEPGMVHIAIAGISGCGKSSLVNSFRGLSRTDAGAARTGIVETTMEVARYPDPDASKDIIWFDVPGAGTLSISDWDYFNDQGLYVFEAIVVVFGDRFCATDIAILKACKKYGIPAYIVRSKSDQYIENMMGDEGEDSGDEDEDSGHKEEDVRRERACQEYAERTRRNVKENLEQAGLPDQDVFLVSRAALLAVIARKKKMPAGVVVLDEERLVEEMIGDGGRGRFKPTPALALIVSQSGSTG